MRRHTSLAAAVLAAALLAPTAGFGHAERKTESPARLGAVPDQNRVHPAVIDVCKTGECDVEHIQSAVDRIPAGNTTPTLIRIWPGLYKEEPSRVVPNGIPDSPDGTFSYEYHLKNPNAENLIGIIGKKNVTLRGMGATPRDVVIDVEFKKHVGIRGDRADGLIVENLSVYHAFDHGVYILDQSGYLIDRVVSGWSRDYGFLMFATDHGLLKNCEAFGAGDAGIYPGGEPNTPGRFSNEVSHCKAYRNVIGYSGTQGNYIWVHDSEFYDNAIGLTSDSETDHPNYPQEHVLIERNRIHDNNFNPYLKDSIVHPVVLEGFAAVPVGVGMFLLTGNDNVIQNNYFWGNKRHGMWLSSQAGVVLGPISDPPAAPFLAEGNQFIANKMYNPAAPAGSQNGNDFGWDGYGLTNCWQDNIRTPEGAPATSDGVMLPPCKSPVDGSRLPLTPGVPNAVDVFEQASMLTFEDTDGDGDMDRPICDATGTCGFEWERGPDPKNARNLPEGYKPPPPPSITCGPSTCPGGRSTTVLGAKQSRTFSARGTRLPATGVGAPLGLGIALLAGAAGVGFSLLRRRFPR